MPATASGKVLVTGANGYIAVWIVHQLLEQGYSVRGTVRAASRGKHLTKLFEKYGDRFELVSVEDITKEGAFDEAVKGVDAIAHTASPVHFSAKHPSEIIGPAVAGTLSILDSARQHGTNVKRIVLTSSTAAILRTLPHPEVFNESNWNTTAIEACETKGDGASPVDMYRASKALAERAAWEYVEKHKGSLSFDLVTLNPPFVFGPMLHETDKAENLNFSMQDWYKGVVTAVNANPGIALGTCWVDVRDISAAHVLALQKEQAGGERIIVSAGNCNWNDFRSVAHSLDSSLPAPDANYDPAKVSYWFSYDTSKAARLLGIKYITLAESTKDMLAQFKEKGFY